MFDIVWYINKQPVTSYKFKYIGLWFHIIVKVFQRLCIFTSYLYGKQEVEEEKLKGKKKKKLMAPTF